MEILDRNDKGEILILLKEDCGNFISGKILWIKSVDSIDKTKTNGYSHVGNFVNDGPYWYSPGQPLVVCSLQGSKAYSLLTFDTDGTCNILLKTYAGHDYAVKMWSLIEKALQVFLIPVSQYRKSLKEEKKRLLVRLTEIDAELGATPDDDESEGEKPVINPDLEEIGDDLDWDVENE
jgi:hypothetical protein